MGNKIIYSLLKNKRMMRKNIYAMALLLALKTASVQAQAIYSVSTFEEGDVDVELNENGFWNGGKIGSPTIGDWGEEIYACTAKSGLATLNVTYSYDPEGGYDWWGGCALSNRASSAFETLSDQYNNVVGGGADGSSAYAVVYGNGSTIDINVTDGAVVEGLYLTNSAYTMKNVVDGDGYSPKFSNEGDYLKLTIVGEKADETTASVDVMLAEYTTELEAITDWQWVDLSSLGSDVKKLTFNFSSHSSGVPQYVCFDNLAISKVYDGISTTDAAAQVTPAARYGVNGQRISGLQKGINIIKMSDGTTRKVLKK